LLDASNRSTRSAITLAWFAIMFAFMFAKSLLSIVTVPVLVDLLGRA
jgi:hypothetical protein